MNKLMGFYELRDSNLPSVPWREYKGETLDPSILWTIRTAVYSGQDLNLPRKIGVTSEDAEKFAKEVNSKYRDNGIVICYPFFLAEKSGTLSVSSNKIIIEAVNEDLWNLVTYGYKDVTVIIESDYTSFVGNELFITEDEINELTSYVGTIKRLFRDDLTEGRAVQLEWSYAYNSDITRKRVGERYLVFYEARTV